MELNAEQIKKALERCKTPSANDCDGCEYDGKCLKNGEYIGCVNLLIADALTLINELTEENKKIGIENFDLICELSRIKADTVRKMHSEIEERCIKGGIYPAFVKRTIDNIAKELLEGANETS